MHINQPFSGDTMLLTEFEIPNGTTMLEQLRYGIAKFPMLEKVIYNAEKAAFGNDGFLGDATGFELEIGTDVKVLPAGFTYISSDASKIVFTERKEASWIQIEAGAMASAPMPFTGLSGAVYLDTNGVLYSVDQETNSAKLIYCPPGEEMTELTIPDTINSQTGEPVSVTAIGQHALKYANLVSISFNPKMIRTLEAYSLNCPTLAWVNGLNEYQTVIDTLKQAGVTIGFRALDNTKLLNAPISEFIPREMNGKKILTIKEDGLADFDIYVSEESPYTWIPKGENEEPGGYQLLTGQTLTVSAGHGNVNAEREPRYRIYFQLTDQEGSTNNRPREAPYTFNGKEVFSYATEDPNTIYLEFTPVDDGQTITIPTTISYPSPQSAGGGLTVWGVILEPEEAETYKEKLVPPKNDEDIIQAQWVTEPVDFSVEKKSTEGDKIELESKEPGNIRLGKDLKWSITLTHGDNDNGNFGKDLAKSVDYIDTMKLPEGLYWEKTVVDAVQAGTVRRIGGDLYVEDTKVFSISGGGRLEWNENEDTISLCWNVRNTSETTELGKVTTNITVYSAAVAGDMEICAQTPEAAVIETDVDASVNFHYSQDQDSKSDAKKTVVSTEEKLEFVKSGPGTARFGEDISYTLNLSNWGTTTSAKAGPFDLNDELENTLFISPQNMERMFAEAYGENLTVTINKASLAPWVNVQGVYGEESWQHPGNSVIGNPGHTLTITKTGQGYQVMVDNGTAYTASTVGEALKAAGYGVTQESQYTCSWKLAEEGENLVLAGGESRTFMIYASAKDTFGQLPGKDWPIQYFTENPKLIHNQAKIENWGETKDISTTVRREASITKQVSRQGKNLGDAPSVNDRDVLDYQLNFTHWGSGAYADLPMVDDMYGNQYLLVSVEDNPDVKIQLETSGQEPEICEQDGVAYYVLNRSGTYKNVVVGVDDEGKSLIAAIVTVDVGDGEVKVEEEVRPYTGVHTQIKWYFPTLPGKDYQKQVKYKALVDIGNQPSYTIGNIVWMNDKPGSRIYASIWGKGSGRIDFDKRIVQTKGDDQKPDILTPESGAYEEGEYSSIGPGETVIYRLTLRHNGTGTTVLTGKDLADALPDTHGIFQWKKDENVKLIDTRTWGKPIVTEKIGNWTIKDSYGNIEKLVEGQQYICWPDDASITFTDDASISLYFQLAFPNNNPSGEPVWDEYEEANEGAMVMNIMYLYDFPSMVHHDLESKGQPMLQKGVYRFSSSTNPTFGAYAEAGENRWNYENRDAQYHGVTYYVALYNDGFSRMYLSDLQDLLPKGFTYATMVTSGTKFVDTSTMTHIVTKSGDSLGVDPLVEFRHSSGRNPVKYKSASITAEVGDKTEDGQKIKFIFGAGDGTNAVKSDSSRGQYYLDKDEAIVFGYVADIGLPEDTEDKATNVIAMPYTDYLKIGLTDQSSTVVNAPLTDHYRDINDGTRKIEPAEQVKQNYGFVDGDEEQWLVSDVFVERGEIVPGITKFTESYKMNENGTEHKYTNSIGHSDTVNWRVHMTNTGTGSLTDYILSDTMPKPFCFTETMSFEIYDANGRKTFSSNILQFPDRTGTDNELEVTNQYKPSSTIKKVEPLKFGDTWTSLIDNKDSLYALSVSVNRDGDGNEVLSLWFEGAGLSITEGGYVDVKFSSKNPTTSYENIVYTNFATLKPNHQEFKSVGQGTGLKDGNGKLIAVRNSSPVAVSFGYTTDSSKHIEEWENINGEQVLNNNKAHSTDPENNYILLKDKANQFQYNLTVENDAEKPMQRLILIDNLPEVGDHTPFSTNAMRESAFKVRLAEKPDFKIKITYTEKEAETEKETETVYYLKKGEYTIQYSEDTEFGPPKSLDWHGEDDDTVADWTDMDQWKAEDIGKVRSIRVMVRGDLNPGKMTVIPAKAKVEVTFNAQIDGKAEPGTIAWNNFGYHYHLVGEEHYLEAMPLVVGVKVPVVPTLEKRLIDEERNPVAAKEDTKFSFLVYTGEELENSEELKTAEELKAALVDAERKFKQYDLTVKKGETSSGEVLLDSDQQLTWVENEKYTIVELPKEGYEFVDFSHAAGKSYTFTYTKDENVTIFCENKWLDWSAKIIKKDGVDKEKLLKGAVFGLYSQDSSDQIDEIPEKYQELEVSERITVGGESWYLTRLQESDDSGEITWDKLTRTRYYLLEVKAPDGYELDESSGKVITRDEAEQGICTVEVDNFAGVELPETGGPGTIPYTAGGLLLLLAGAGSLMYKNKNSREKEGQCPVKQDYAVNAAKKIL